MKKLLGSVFILFALSAHAQKDFEGMIKYLSVDGSGNLDEKDANDVIRIYFTPGKILIRQDGDTKINEDILIIFDSAKAYRLDRKKRTYSVKRLMNTITKPVATKQVIAGYSATPLFPAGPMGFTAIGTTWYADELYFHIPPGFETNEELIMVRNNRILLKAEMGEEAYPDYGWDEEEEENTNMTVRNFSFSLTAVEIKHGGINPADFLIPADYVKEKRPQYDAVMDSTTVTMDTMTIESPPPPPPKAPARKNEKEKPAEQTVKTTVEKSPARKQDS